MKILSIIPARGGSKGIRDKNIIDVGGKPLLAYSIEQGLWLKEQGLVDTLVVSTDSEKIATVANRYSSGLALMRPSEISDDRSKSIDFYVHALDFFEKKGVNFDAVMLLQPTAPLRSFDVLKKSIQGFEANGADSLLSVYKEDYICDLVMYSAESSDLLQPLNPQHNKGVRRQEHGATYVRNGAIYITRVDFLLREKLIISDKPAFVEMRKADSINIDGPEDLDILRKIIASGD